MERTSQRQSFLLSALVHVIMITLLIRTATRPVPVPPPVSPPVAAAAPDRRVFLPPPAELRRMAPATPRPAAPSRPAPTPVPTPPPREARDRISVGAPSELRQREPLVLERDRDLSSAPAAPGRPGLPAATPSPAPPEPTAEARGGDPGATPSPPPSGRGQAPLVGPPRGERSITSSLRNLERRLGEMGAGGTGAAGQQMGPLFFDPEGADFTAWINHFKNEVYRNWIVPQAALLGVRRGHVDFQFTVSREGTLADLRMLKSSGTPALDRAAANALIGARYLALPAEYRPGSVTMQVSFFYGEVQGS